MQTSDNIAEAVAALKIISLLVMVHCLTTAGKFYVLLRTCFCQLTSNLWHHPAAPCQNMTRWISGLTQKIHSDILPTNPIILQGSKSVKFGPIFDSSCLFTALVQDAATYWKSIHQ